MKILYILFIMHFKWVLSEFYGCSTHVGNQEYSTPFVCSTTIWKKKAKRKKKERKREWNACLSRVGSTCGGAPSPTLPLDSLGPYDGRRIFLLGRQMFYHCLEMRARGKRGSGRRQKGASTAHSEHTPRLAQFCLFFSLFLLFSF